MKAPLTSLIALLCLGLALTARAQEAPVTTKEDRAMLLKKVDQSEKDLIKLVSKLTPEQWTYVPEDGGWSIAGVCEHILIAENGFQMFAGQTMTSPADGSRAEEMRGQFEGIFAYVDRTQMKAEAPETARPTGTKYATPDAFLAELKEVLAKKREMIKTADLRAHLGKDPRGNDTDAYNLLAFATAHTLRHTLQAVEVTTEGKYPTKK